MAKKRKLEIIDDPNELKKAPPVTKETVRRALTFTGWTIGLVTLIFGAAFVLLQGEHFLSTDHRFRIAEEGYAAKDDAITLNGIHKASRKSILKIFDRDRGRSLSGVDPEERRLELRRVEWVRDASVRRVWPNHLQVNIEERQPVAIVQVPARITADFNNPVAFQPMLIDDEGVLLHVRGPIPQNLPLLVGIRPSDDVERRRVRVLRMLRLLDELQDSREQIQEVDVSDPENLRITFQAPDQQVILILGNEKFRDRLNTFLRHYDGIRDRLPQRAVLDVSMESRINAVTPLEAPRK